MERLADSQLGILKRAFPCTEELFFRYANLPAIYNRALLDDMAARPLHGISTTWYVSIKHASRTSCAVGNRGAGTILVNGDIEIMKKICAARKGALWRSAGIIGRHDEVSGHQIIRKKHRWRGVSAPSENSIALVYSAE